MTPVRLEFVCTTETFVPRPDARVRWLDRVGDFSLVREAWRTRGVPISSDDWADWARDGYRFSGIVEDGRLVSWAAAWAYSDAAWELAAVATREGARGRGYATAVASFVTASIFAAGRVATCHVDARNAGMIRVATRLGFRRASQVNPAGALGR